MIKKEKSEKAKEAIESSILIIKSVEFLEAQAKKTIDSLEKLERKYEASFDFQEKELLMRQIEDYEPKLRQLIRRCEIENNNVTIAKKKYNIM